MWRCWPLAAGQRGITAAAELAGRVPRCQVLILTGLEAPGNLAAARHAGVAWFSLKDGPAAEFIAAVQAVARGERVMGTRLASRVPGWPQEPDQAW
jgi:two-component system, NarL family, response regulator DesR